MSLSDAETRRDKGKGVSTKALSRKSVRTSTPRRDHSPNSSEEEKPIKKGGKKSSKAAYERVEEEEEERGEPSKRDRRKKAEAEEESDDDVPISRRRNVITTPRKKSISRNGVKAVIGLFFFNNWEITFFILILIKEFKGVGVWVDLFNIYKLN